MAMSEELNKPISFDEYKKEISLRPKDKSPGITGVTINMLKACPIGLLSELHGILSLPPGTDEMTLPAGSSQSHGYIVGFA